MCGCRSGRRVGPGVFGVDISLENAVNFGIFWILAPWAQFIHVPRLALAHVNFDFYFSVSVRFAYIGHYRLQKHSIRLTNTQ